MSDHRLDRSRRAAAVPKPKKSVALSGVTAGNTALCTVGRTGNDLHYRGYDILDLAENCEFEEIAYLLVHGKLPNAAELVAYKAQAQGAARHPGGRAGRPRVASRPPPIRWTCCAPAARCWARSCPKATTTSSRRRATSPTA